ncbi:ComEA family DNA-binding protein [Nocardioides panacisoli]|nr:ComEA family DNA-binding protein [Nocardioides panacisoli]
MKTAGLNLARVLTDGEQIVVGRPAAAVGPPASPGAERPVNLNLAQQAELEELPGVGPVTAAAIIAWREEHGGFRSVDQLIDVSGIGEKTLAEIAPRVTV